MSSDARVEDGKSSKCSNIVKINLETKPTSSILENTSDLNKGNLVE